MLTTFINNVTNQIALFKKDIDLLKNNLHSLEMQNKNALSKNIPENLTYVLDVIKDNINVSMTRIDEILSKIPVIEEPVFKDEVKAEITKPLAPGLLK